MPASSERVPKATWQSIVEQLTHGSRAGRAVDGFVAAVESVGDASGDAFPAGHCDANELPDHLIVLDRI